MEINKYKKIIIVMGCFKKGLPLKPSRNHLKTRDTAIIPIAISEGNPISVLKNKIYEKEFFCSLYDYIDIKIKL